MTRSDAAGWLNQYFANPQMRSSRQHSPVGNAPRTIPTVRAPGTGTTALSLFKQFKLTLLCEGGFLEFRAETFNALNHGTANSPRTMQMGMKLYF